MNVYVDGPWADKQDKLLRYTEDEHSVYIDGPLNMEGLEIVRTDSDETSFITHDNTGSGTAIYGFSNNAIGTGDESGYIYIGACWSWPGYTSLPTPGIYSHEGQDIHIIAHEIALTAQDTDTPTEFEVDVRPDRAYFNGLEIYSDRQGANSVFIDGPRGGIMFGKDLYDKNGGKLSGFDRIKEDGNSVYIDGPLEVTNVIRVCGTSFVAGPGIVTISGREFSVNGGNGTEFSVDDDFTYAKKICVNSLFVDGPTVIDGDIFATDDTSSLDTQGLNIWVSRSDVSYPNNGLGIKELGYTSVDSGLRLYPCLCSYHTGPHICGWHGSSTAENRDFMHIVSGRGGGIALTIQDSNGSPRTARLTYENITKLIALLESTD